MSAVANCASPLLAALPTLDIAEGALDSIFRLYKQLLPKMGGYLTHAGELNRPRLELLLAELAALEQQTLEQRAQVGTAPTQMWLGKGCRPKGCSVPAGCCCGVVIKEFGLHVITLCC